MDFVKMEGLGNDFIVVAGPAELGPADIARWCDRRRGIGADGVLEVSPLDEGTVRMRYWNADGSIAEMCGNGLRCVARYAVDQGLVDVDSFVVETGAGPLPVHLEPDGSVRAFLGTAHLDAEVEFAGATLYTVNLGNPHAIQWVADPETSPVASMGPAIATAALFPGGTNAEFARVVDGVIDLRVWERGVGETLACGTGAGATAYLAHRQGRTGDQVKIRLRGGTLSATIDDGDGVWLQGPAVTVFSGVI